MLSIVRAALQSVCRPITGYQLSWARRSVSHEASEQIRAGILGDVLLSTSSDCCFKSQCRSLVCISFYLFPLLELYLGSLYQLRDFWFFDVEAPALLLTTFIHG